MGRRDVDHGRTSYIEMARIEIDVNNGAEALMIAGRHWTAPIDT